MPGKTERYRNILRILERVQETKAKHTAAVLALEDVTTKIEIAKANYDKPAAWTGIVSDRVGHSVEVREDFIDRIRATENDYLAAAVEAIRLLGKVKDSKAYSVLSARYIQGMQVDEIAKTMDYSISHIYLLRNRGLQEILENLNDDDAGKEDDPRHEN